MDDRGPSVRRLGGDWETLVYAVSLLRDRRIDDARAEAERILQSNDRFLPAAVGIGITHLIQRKGREALQYFERAAAIDPMAPGPLVLSGFAHLSLSNLDRAEAAFRSALNLNPELPTALFGMARACQRKGDLPTATLYVERAVELVPQFKPARVVLAALRGKAGDR